MPDQQASTAPAFVIFHPKEGIYLGNCLGMGFWSMLDPVGQPCAVTFPTIEEAQGHINQWDSDLIAQGIEFKRVQADQLDANGCWYASIDACVLAGLPAWDPNEGMRPERDQMH